jgi:hypothetical protein
MLLSGANENVMRALQSTTPVFSFTMLDEGTFRFSLESNERNMNAIIKLGEETEMERRDGSKVNHHPKLATRSSFAWVHC